MHSGPLLFFALAVVGALTGLFLEVPGWSVAVVIALSGIASLFSKTRLLRALPICFAIATFTAWEATSAKRSFDETLSTLSYEQKTYEGVLEDLSDALSGDRVGVLRMKSGMSLGLRLKGAASSKVMRIGDTIRVKGKVSKAQHALSPGQIDGYWFGLSRQVHGRMTLSNPHLIAVMQTDLSPPLISRVKQNIKNQLSSYLTPRETGLLLALVVGDLKLFDDEQQQVYRNIGVGHLLGIGGLQVSLLCMIFYRCLLVLFLLVPWISRRSLARYPTLIVTLILVWGFVVLCGAPPAALRAGLMSSLMLSASAFAWPTTSMDVYGTSGIICLFLWPAWVIDPSFWLSFAAVFGMIAAAEFAKIPQSELPILTPQKSSASWLTKVRAMAIVSLGAGLFTLPFSVYYFAELSLSGLIVNLFVVPIAGFLQTPAILFAGASMVLGIPWLSQVAAFFVNVLEMVCMTLDDWLGRSYPMMPIFAWELLVACFASFFLLASARPRYRVFKLSVAATCGALLLLPTSQASDALVATFLPVGQGDGAVLQIPPGKVVVIDGGGNYEDKFNPGERIVAPFLRRRGIDKIDVVVLSHPDADHLMGLIPLVENFEVHELWHSNFDGSHPLMARLLDAAKRRGVKVLALVDLPGQVGDAKFDYFSTREKGAELGTTNNRSLVLRVSYKGHSILFPGDVEAPLEDALRGQDFSATIVKAPHHGSKSSSTPAFVEATKARHVVFCTGVNNRFGFPHSQVIKRWQDSGATLWDTAKNGETAFILDGHAVQVKPFIATF